VRKVPQDRVSRADDQSCKTVTATVSRRGKLDHTVHFIVVATVSQPRRRLSACDMARA